MLHYYWLQVNIMGKVIFFTFHLNQFLLQPYNYLTCSNNNLSKINDLWIQKGIARFMKPSTINIHMTSTRSWCCQVLLHICWSFLVSFSNIRDNSFFLFLPMQDWMFLFLIWFFGACCVNRAQFTTYPFFFASTPFANLSAIILFMISSFW
jgi:hypothetical protein